MPANNIERSSTPLWLQRMFLGAGLLALGNWALSQYPNGWTSSSILDSTKAFVGRQTSGPYVSTLTEPWNKVRNFVRSFLVLLFLRAINLKYHCVVGRILFSRAKSFPRSPQEKNSNIIVASATSNAPGLMYPWTGITPSSATLASGSQSSNYLQEYPSQIQDTEDCYGSKLVALVHLVSALSSTTERHIK